MHSKRGNKRQWRESVCIVCTIIRVQSSRNTDIGFMRQLANNATSDTKKRKRNREDMEDSDATALKFLKLYNKGCVFILGFR